MARSSPSKAIKPATASTSLALVDEQLATEIAGLKNSISQPSGNRIRAEATGDFVLPDGTNIGNSFQAVIVDFVSRNTFYSSPYNPQNPAPPDCYAIGRDIGAMAPEQDSPALQADKCATCPLNQFGSGSNGKSKACKNTRELAVRIVDAEAGVDDAQLYTLSLPPTAIRSFDGAVATVMRSLNGPPLKAILSVSARNKGTYAEISFNDPVPNPTYAQDFARRSEVQDVLFRKPDFGAHQNQPQTARGRAAVPARRATPGPRR
ncbi:MAG: hypothetical protein DDT39_00027 [Firmicutes bacterium]|nr:hypothetical protein [candidate division NPL-UPA2 bacterium]